MDTVVLKFGGSSLSDNLKLNIVANKIIEFYNKGNKIVVVVSAQGKTTDNLIKEAKELSSLPNERELDVLLSTGEQVSIAKLSILLNMLGYKSISLTGWQAGILTSNNNQNAKIENIDVTRILKELEDNIVIVAGFQGINSKGDITTLGRGGSDTTAVAIAASIKANHCYIFSDVDGVYSTDPNKITIAKKLQTLSYMEMQEIADEGAKVLHNRCVEVGAKFNIPIITKSTFNNKQGTVICNKIEDNKIKSIVKNDDIIYIKLKYENYSLDLFNKLYKTLLINDIQPNNLVNRSTYNLNISFNIKANDLNKFQRLLENDLSDFDVSYTNITKIAIVGFGITNNNDILNKTLNILQLNNIEILNMEMGEAKIVITFGEKLPDGILSEIHKELIE